MQGGMSGTLLYKDMVMTTALLTLNCKAYEYQTSLLLYWLRVHAILGMPTIVSVYCVVYCIGYFVQCTFLMWFVNVAALRSCRAQGICMLVLLLLICSCTTYIHI